jgi:hypothetical protein
MVSWAYNDEIILLLKSIQLTCHILSLKMLHVRPTRWDEWIHMSSPRISPFRSRTLHQLSSATNCPVPNTPLNNAPVTGVDDIRLVLPDIVSMFNRISPLLERSAVLSREVTNKSLRLIYFYQIMTNEWSTIFVNLIFLELGHRKRCRK